MPFEFAEIPTKTVEVKYEFRGQTLNATINPDKITQDVANGNDYAWAIFAILDKWDAKNEPTLGFLRGLPLEFLIGFFSACQRAAFPKATTAEQ